MSTISVMGNDNGGGRLDLELGCQILPPAVVMMNGGGGGDGMFFAGNVAGDLSSSSCSSIGKNSDDDDDAAGDGEEEEVESKSGSFDAIQALEEALPFRRGISRHYNGKSKSFTSLADATPLPSIKEIVKPENAYTRKRRNLLASSLLWEDNNNKDDDSDERPSKKSCINVNRTTSFAFAVAMNNAASSNIDQASIPNTQIKQSQMNVSASHIRNLSALRSYSMADLQRCQ